MTEAEELLRTASLFDTPHTQAGHMQRQELARNGLDLAGCNICTIVMALNEFDLKKLDKLGHRFETWPDDVKAQMEKVLGEFAARNKGAKIEAITQAIGGEPKAFILCLHWRPKQ